MAELPMVTAPVSAANKRDPSPMTRMPRSAGFQPPLMVSELRLAAVSRATRPANSGPAGGSGPTIGLGLAWTGGVVPDPLAGAADAPAGTRAAADAGSAGRLPATRRAAGVKSVSPVGGA